VISGQKCPKTTLYNERMIREESSEKMGGG